MHVNDKNFTVELNEHDLLTLMNLVKREINETERVWHPYWQQLLQKMRTGMEQDLTRRNQPPPSINQS